MNLASFVRTAAIALIAIGFEMPASQAADLLGPASRVACLRVRVRSGITRRGGTRTAWIDLWSATIRRARCPGLRAARLCHAGAVLRTGPRMLLDAGRLVLEWLRLGTPSGSGVQLGETRMKGA